ncbi:MAG: S-layer homology domain-containing protein [Clostridia bacterium]|nr:S-layer homology domain-containing protein [Clostridia bacterium]
MKKVLAVLMVIIMAMSVLPAYAAESLPEEVLLKVKTKIHVPEELKEFSYSENKRDNIIRYDFTWHTENYEKELYVSSDSLGRIVSYNYYEQMDYSADRTLIGYTKPDAHEKADAFVRGAYPEYFENNTDTLVLNEDSITSSYQGRYKAFSFKYERFYKGEVMESNAVTVRVRATKDKIYVQSATAALDEGATFVEGNAVNIGEKDYNVHFPIKLYYATDYSAEKETVTLFYSMEKGFVSRIDGVQLKEKRFDRYAEYGVTEETMMDSMATGGTLNKNTASLTPEEIAALEEVKALISAEEVAAKLREIELLHITDDMKLTESSIHKYNDGYSVSFTLDGTYQNTYVTYNGETGEVTRINTYLDNATSKYYTGEKAEEEKVVDYSSNEESVEAFTKLLAGDKVEEASTTFTYNGDNLEYDAERIVNDVPYPENKIRTVYDAQKEFVTSYYIYWDKDVTAFPKPSEAISLDEATKIMFNVSPVYNNWVGTEKGYTPAITIPASVTINAITGEIPYTNKDVKAEYTDITSHWAEKYINILWEHDIYLTGDKFAPDEPINQADMIRLFSACRDNGIIPIGGAKAEITKYAFENGYVEASEPDKLMTRREAFKALVEILGYGDIAEFDIYKSSYSDMEPNGSAEILKAMGILVGDSARPDDYLTHAEAAVMVYRYLSK